ncbi:hypothetical protein [Nonomuraea fuscirosea]
MAAAIAWTTVVIAAMISLGACGFLMDRAVQLAFARPLRWVSEGAH